MSESEEAIGWDDLPRTMERLCPSSYVEAMDRTRPYDGQGHTTHGVRGATMVEGLTFRDVRDCLIRAAYLSSGLPPGQWPGTVYGLPWRDMDFIAVAQNLACEMERMMGIFPNLPQESVTERDRLPPDTP